VNDTSPFLKKTSRVPIAKSVRTSLKSVLTRLSCMDEVKQSWISIVDESQ
jgi:hypothetical protein